jgi:dTDP-4-dehydrorhamnose reductase
VIVAESEEALATAVNGAAPAAIAAACAAQGIPLVHISTDYVFDGSGTQPWRPDDPPAPLGAYGASKLAGEDGVRAAGGPHAILRTSWVFSAHGGNFVKTMLRLGAEREHLRIVGDQVGGPTPAADIAGACAAIAAGAAPLTAKAASRWVSAASTAVQAAALITASARAPSIAAAAASGFERSAAWRLRKVASGTRRASSVATCPVRP